MEVLITHASHNQLLTVYYPVPHQSTGLPALLERLPVLHRGRRMSRRRKAEAMTHQTVTLCRRRGAPTLQLIVSATLLGTEGTNGCPLPTTSKATPQDMNSMRCDISWSMSPPMGTRRDTTRMAKRNYLTCVFLCTMLDADVSTQDETIAGLAA